MDCNLFQTLGQVSSDEVGQVFRDHIRGCVRQMITEVMASEFSELCGPKHHPDKRKETRERGHSNKRKGTFYFNFISILMPL